MQRKKRTTQVPGVRVFTCGHSFHWFVYDILDDLVRRSGIGGYVPAGLSKIGGSRVVQHWDVPEAKNQATAQCTQVRWIY
ncbi:MAG: hypothetical protein ABIF71_11215 [Planctomycetota bacterium]